MDWSPEFINKMLKLPNIPKADFNKLVQQPSLRELDHVLQLVGVAGATWQVTDKGAAP